MAGLARELGSGGSSAWASADGHPALLQPQQHAAMSENGIVCHTSPRAHLEKKLQHNHCLNTTLLFSLLCKTSSWEFCYSLKFKYIPPSTFLGPPECIHTSAWKVAHAPWAAGCILGWVLFGLDILLFHLFLRCKPHNEFHGFCEQL